MAPEVKLPKVDINNGLNRADLYTVLQDEIASMGVLNTLTMRLQNWIQRPENKKVLGPEVFAQIENSVNDDPVAALVLIAESLSPVMVHRTMKQTEKQLRRFVRAGFSEAEDRKIELGAVPPALTPGSQCHIIGEKLLVDESPLPTFNTGFVLEMVDGKAVGFLDRKEVAEEWKSPMFGDIQIAGKTVDGGDIFKTSGSVYVGSLDGENGEVGISRTLKPNINTMPVGGGETQRKKVLFQTPIRLEDGHNQFLRVFETARKKYWQILERYQKETGRLLEKPSDISRCLLGEHGNDLRELIELSHFLIGTESGLSQIEWNDEGGGVVVDEFRAIDTLSILRLAFERFEGKEYLGVGANLIEIQEGDIWIEYKHRSSESETTIKRDQEVRSGRIDILNISFASEKKARKNLGTDIDLIKPITSFDGGVLAVTNYRKVLLELVGGNSEPVFNKATLGKAVLIRKILSYMEATAGSNTIDGGKVTWTSKDVKRWGKKFDKYLIRRDFGKNPSLDLAQAVKSVEKRFKKGGRDLKSLFMGLYEIYGARVFWDLELNIVDLKFPAGDSGGHEVYISANLPQEKDIKQVAGYLFKAASQLYTVYLLSTRGLKVEKGNSFIKKDEERPLSMASVVSFIRKYKLWERIKGRLLYQTTISCIQEEVLMKRKRSNLLESGLSAFRIDPQKNDEIGTRIKALRTLRKVIGLKTKDIPTSRRVAPEVPEVLQSICLQDKGGRNLLSISNLEYLIRTSLENGIVKSPLTVDCLANIDMAGREFLVFWVNNLVDGAPRLRISVDKMANFTISGGDIFLKGKVISLPEFLGVHEDNSDLYKYYQDHIFTPIWKELYLADLFYVNDGGVAYRSGDWDAKVDQILFPDGSLKQRVDGKPIICNWNPMSGGWYLDPKLLAIAAESGHDKHGTLKVYDLVRKKFRGKRMVLCPMCTHRNTDKTSPAAEWNLHHNFAHIICRNPNCGVSVDITKAVGAKKKWREIATIPENFQVSNYHEVRAPRIEVVKWVMRTAEAFARVDSTLGRYLIDARGLSPDDVGRVGFIPPWFVNTLRNMSNNPTFKELLEKDEPGGVMANFINRSRALGLNDPGGRFVGGMVELLGRLDDLEAKTGERIDDISANLIARMADPEADNVIGKGSHLGGGAVMPLYWPSKTSPIGFEVSNVNVRGIIATNGKSLYTGRGHWKIRLESSGDGESTSDWKEQAPAGIWVRDVKNFLSAVAKHKTVYVTEGIFNAATIRRIGGIASIPEIVDTGMATVGTGYRTFYAFLRHLGVVGDKKPPEGCLGLGIENIILAPDFDSPGTGYFNRRFGDLTQLFDGLGVYPIHTVLPGEIANFLPKYDTSLFGTGKPLESFKLDMNDLVQAHGPNWSPIPLGQSISNEVLDMVENLKSQAKHFRQIYAYIPK